MFRDATTIADANRIRLLKMTHDMQETIAQMDANDQRIYEEHRALRQVLGKCVDQLTGAPHDPNVVIQAKQMLAMTKRELVS